MAADCSDADCTGRRVARRLMAAAGAACIAVLVASGALVSEARAQSPAVIEAQQQDGYGRIVLTFKDRLPGYKITTSSGVVVVALDTPEAPDMSRVPDLLRTYVAAARRDPDGKALRVALAQPVSVNSMEAGEKLFIDLLPADWVGVPPGLPADVVAELARRAEAAEEKRRKAEILESFLNSKPVEVRITSLPTFTRFVFVWDRFTEATIEKSVESALVAFDRPARIDLTGLKSRLPAYVSEVTSRFGENGLEILFKIDPEAPVRGFREDNTYVVDITAPISVGAGLETRDESADRSEASVSLPAADGGAEGASESLATDPSVPPVRSSFMDTEAENLDMRAEAGAPAGVAPPGDDSVQEGAQSELVSDDYLASELPMVRPEARRFGESVKLTLPFEAPTPAAVFERTGSLWAVFETPQVIDTRLLKDNLRDIASSVESWRMGAVTVLRITLSRPSLASANGEATSWIITIGDLPVEPGDRLDILREVGSKGLLEATVKYPTANAIHEVEDRETGETLFVVTALGPSRSVAKDFNFVEFSAPQTIHSFVVNPIADDIDVMLDGEFVRITRASGLVVSEVEASYAAAPSEPFEAARPGFVDRFDDSALDPGSVYRLLAQHIREAAEADETDRTQARLRLAHALLATDLGAEALAQLNLVEQDDPGALRDPSLRALRGIAMVMMGRPDEALLEFDAFGLSQSTDVSLWRGLAERDRGNWQAARTALEAGDPAISSYSKARQKQFGLAAAEAALEMNDIATASVRLAELTEMEEEGDPKLDLLNARLAAVLGQRDAAVEVFDTIIAGKDRRMAAEARLLRADVLRAANGGVVDEEIVEELERLAISWRGDEIELGALRLLANTYVANSDYYRAFEVMKSATLADSDSPTTRALQDDMNAAFERLFLGGDSDELPAIDALSLYYDFRELTPIGRKGDEIIRNLAGRLVEVDLLDQASELLRHQVDKRLKGAARAQVAARLAWIYLRNRKPADAIVVLSRTRQAILPQEVSYQRLLLEARALSETGRTELALDLLSTAKGPEVDEVLADVLWKGREWQKAGEVIERSLEAIWDGPDQLDATQRAVVLRGAISYALANDQLGLQRFRQKFLPKMANSADARAFDVVTLPMPENINEFNELVAKVAAVDTLDAFLEEYRQRYVVPSEDSDRFASNS